MNARETTTKNVGNCTLGQQKTDLKRECLHTNQTSNAETKMRHKRQLLLSIAGELTTHQTMRILKYYKWRVTTTGDWL